MELYAANPKVRSKRTLMRATTTRWSGLLSAGSRKKPCATATPQKTKIGNRQAKQVSLAMAIQHRRKFFCLNHTARSTSRHRHLCSTKRFSPKTPACFFFRTSVPFGSFSAPAVNNRYFGFLDSRRSPEPTLRLKSAAERSFNLRSDC